MRTTYGSPLFADARADADSLLVERLRRAGAIVIGKTNTPEFGAGSQTFNAVFGATRNPWDLARTPGRVERRGGGRGRGGDAAVRRRLRPRGAASATRPPSAALVGLRPSPGGVPRRARRPVEPAAGARADRAHGRRRRAAAVGAGGPDPRDPLSLGEPFAGASAGDVRGLRIGWSRDARRAAGRAGGDGGARGAARDVRGARVRGRGRRAGLRAAPTRLRGAARRDASRAPSRRSCDQVKPTLAENIRFGLALTPERIARALELRGELFARMHEFLRATTCSPRRSRRSPPFTSTSSSRARSRACGWAPTSSGSAPARGSRSRRIRRSRCRPGSRRTGCRSGSSSSAAHRGEAALLRLARAFDGDRARGAPAGALMPWPTSPPTAAHRAAYADAEPHPFWLVGGAPARPALTGVPRRTCASSAAVSPGCGRRCMRRRWTRRVMSSCSRPRPRASAPPGATAGSASRR